MVIVVGTRQLGLFVLMHDGTHAVLHRKVNDWVAHWLCSHALARYRPYHLQHHRHVRQTEDPDLVLSAPFPIDRTSFARKGLRDLTGRTFAKQRFGRYLDRLRARQPGESARALLIEALARDRRVLPGNALGSRCSRPPDGGGCASRCGCCRWRPGSVSSAASATSQSTR